MCLCNGWKFCKSQRKRGLKVDIYEDYEDYEDMRIHDWPIIVQNECVCIGYRTHGRKEGFLWILL